MHASAAQREAGATIGEQAGHGGQGATLEARRAARGGPDARASALRLPAPASGTTAATRRSSSRRSAASRGASSSRSAEALCANSGRERTSAFVYAVGWTQHTVGVQYIRAAAIIQLLLGNIGRPGGGIMALRGHASIQGSTDIPTLYNILPGYIPMPHAAARTRPRAVHRAERVAEPASGATWTPTR